jgi:hypothetical protein
MNINVHYYKSLNQYMNVLLIVHVLHYMMLIKLKLSTEKKKLIKLKYIQGHNLDNSSKFENL